MKGNKIFKYLIIFVILILIILLIVLLSIRRKSSEENNFEEESFKEEEMAELEIDENIDEINQLNTFCMAEKIITEHLNPGNIFYASKIYFQETDIVVSYRLYVFGEIFDPVNKTDQNAFYAIDFDTTAGTYKITQQKTDIEQTEFEQIATTGDQRYVINENLTGEYLQEDITDNEKVKRYFEYYKMLILTNSEKAFSLLDEEYKTLRFVNYDNFNKYIQDNLTKLENMQFSKFEINYFDEYDQYVVYTSDEEYYIFSINDIMDFSVVLDQYIVDIPQFVSKYEASDVRVKVGLNINKFIMGINDKNYNYVFTLLADSFKNTNNLTTVADLENYLRNNFYDQNEVEFLVFSEQGSYYVYTLNLKDKNGTETKDLKIVMQLEEGTDFKMSFSF